jgi:hypothetical protein
VKLDDYRLEVNAAIQNRDVVAMRRCRSAFVDEDIEPKHKYRLLLMSSIVPLWYSSGDLAKGFNVTGRPTIGSQETVRGILRQDKGEMWLPVPLPGTAKR